MSASLRHLLAIVLVFAQGLLGMNAGNRVCFGLNALLEHAHCDYSHAAACSHDDTSGAADCERGSGDEDSTESFASGQTHRHGLPFPTPAPSNHNHDDCPTCVDVEIPDSRIEPGRVGHDILAQSAVMILLPVPDVLLVAECPSRFTLLRRDDCERADSPLSLRTTRMLI